MFSNKFMKNSSFLGKKRNFMIFFFKIRKCFFYFLENTRVFFFDMILIFCTYCQVGGCILYVFYLACLHFFCVCVNITARGVKLCDGLVKLQAKALSKQAGKHNVKVQNVVKFDNKQDALASFVNHGHIKCNNCFYD